MNVLEIRRVLIINMKDYIISNKKGIILVILGVMILIVMLLLYHRCSHQEFLVSSISTFEAKITEPESKRVLSEEELLSIYVNDNLETINFFADVFKINRDTLIERLKGDYKNINLLNTEDLEYTISEYLFALEENNRELFDNSIDACDDSKDYMLALLNYFSSIYSNVDFSIAAAIAQIESGYTAQSMLKKNNIFGGMSGGSLIKYKNIEYGILSYVKLLSDGYFGKGLVTVEDIGKVYNPTYNENGVKIAKPSWVNKVNNALEEFRGMVTVVSVSQVMTLKAV